MTPEQQHIAMSSHACDQANELQDLRNRLTAAGDSLAGVPIRATELSRNAGAQTFGLYMDRADADLAITKSPCRDLRTHDLVRREDVAGVVGGLHKQIDFTEWYLAIISKLLGSPVPLEIDDIAVRLNMLIIERDAARADLAAKRVALRSAECSYSGMSYGDDKAGGPSDYTRGWGDCLAAIKAAAPAGRCA